MMFPAGQRALPRSLANHVDGLTHDLRNVMASLQLCAEVMGQPGVLMPGNEYLAGEVRSVVNAAVGLLQRFGTLTEGNAGGRVGWTAREDLQGARVGEVMADVEGLLRRVAGPGVRLEMACAPCRGRMAMPAEDVARVLINLVRNASEAMPKGGRIRVTAQMANGQSFALRGQTMQSAEAVLICVQDDGPGVAKEIARQIFQPGFSTKACVHGGAGRDLGVRRGLGLAMARELVEMAGGSLKLASCARGARFEVEIPLTNVMPSWASRAQFDGQGGRA
ncbi:MAG: sensor histidine kinase [Acidobacteriaceae bacterium]